MTSGSRPYDPERGLRGAMSGMLVLEGITILLAIPVAVRIGEHEGAGKGAGPLAIVAVILLALASIALCAFVNRPWFVPAVFALQALTVLGWFITPTLGVMGIVFGLCWAFVLWLRTEFRRRLKAGTLPKAPEQ